jgi:hypothetical protein
MHERYDPAIVYIFASEIFTDEFHVLPDVANENSMSVLIAAPKIIRECEIIRCCPYCCGRIKDEQSDERVSKPVEFLAKPYSTR